MFVRQASRPVAGGVEATMRDFRCDSGGISVGGVDGVLRACASGGVHRSANGVAAGVRAHGAEPGGVRRKIRYWLGQDLNSGDVAVDLRVGRASNFPSCRLHRDWRRCGCGLTVFDFRHLGGSATVLQCSFAIAFELNGSAISRPDGSDHGSEARLWVPIRSRLLRIGAQRRKVPDPMVPDLSTNLI